MIPDIADKVQAPSLPQVLALAGVGLPLVPLERARKKPQLQDYIALATTDPATLAAWWAKFPGSDVGTIVRPGHLVLDCDPRHGGTLGFQTLFARHGALPPTWRTWTGRNDGGFHMHFTTHDLTIPYTTDIDQGVQILGPGHLVLLPPSAHEQTGLPYTWDAIDAPWNGPAAEAPDWLIDLVHQTTTFHNKLTGKRTAKKGACTAPNKVPSEGGGLGTLFEGAKHTPSESRSARLVTMACDPAHLPALLAACGLPTELQVGMDTHCPCHEDVHPSATLLGPDATHSSFGLFCHACKKYYSLTDIFYQRTSQGLLPIHSETAADGQVKHHGALRLQWLTRLLEAAGVLHLHELGAPTLPPTAPAEARDLWALFLHVRRIRSTTRERQAPLPFSLRFIQDWSGAPWTLHAVAKAKRFLILHGFLLHAYTDHQQRFWKVGSPPLRQARRTATCAPRAREDALVAEVAATEVLPPPAPSSACPDAALPEHDDYTCALCDVQRLLVAKRQANGIWHTKDDPYGVRRGTHYETSVLTSEED